jgi:hypothetical protein
MKPAAAHIAAMGGSFRIDPFGPRRSADTGVLRDLARQGAKVQTIDHGARNSETMICLMG